MTSSANFTCITCRVVFSSADVQRTHYQTDWHTYNLKRKVAGLNPVTAERFNEKVLTQRAQAENEGKSESVQCLYCNKHFASTKALVNHQGSKRHKENVKRKNKEREGGDGVGGKKDKEKQEEKVEEKGEEEVMEEDDDSSVESWSGEALGLEQCLFCPSISNDLEGNLRHMARGHSFFIPDSEYVVDLEGLIAYLGQKVGEGCVCLWCNRQRFPDVKAVQQHMVDKGHCQVKFEGQTVYEFSDYYDYSAGYTDGEDPDAELPAELELEMGDNFQLALPSGQVIGHRSLQRYYRQKLRPERPRATNASRILAQYRGLGPCSDAAMSLRARDMTYLRRHREKNHLRLGLKANRFQKHFRDDNFGIRH